MDNDPRLDTFLNGGDYPDTNGVVREKGCSSCAFIDCPETVRTSDISVVELLHMTAELDDFVCHEPEGGQIKRCRRWHLAHRAHQGEAASSC